MGFGTSRRSPRLALGFLLATSAGGVQAQTYNITFDAGDPIGGLPANTILGSQYAAATGATFTPNAFSGASSLPGGSGTWATNTNVTVVTNSGQGALGTPTLASGNILHSLTGWQAENGDPSVRMSFANPASTVSVDFAGIASGVNGTATRLIAFDAAGAVLQTTLAIQNSATSQQTLTVSSATSIASVAIVPGSFIDWVGIDNIRFTLVPQVSPPVFGYAPAPSATVSATGGTTIGSTGNLSIAVSVATAGSGTGTAATTTTTCTAPTAPFAGFGQTVTAVGTGAITGGPLAGTCTLGAAVATQTLTCSENSGGNLFTRTWTLSCPAGTPVAPTIAYNPGEGTPVLFTGVTTIGSTGNGSIAATPSGGSGSGAAGTTTINNCTFGGANPGSFAGAAAINLSFVGDTTTPQNLALTCTSGATALAATLTCEERRGAAAPVPRNWQLSCPAGAVPNTPPTIAYNPTTGTDVAFTGVTTIGTTGNGTIVATPSGGSGSGAAATTTINTCTLGGANPGSFAGAAAINMSFVGSTTTPQNLALTCTSAASVQTATLTCLETRGVVTPPQVSGIAPNPAPRQWNLSCPAGAAVAPTIAYNPNAGSPVNFTGVTTIGTTGNGTIAATPSGGIGTGAAATTTINTCTLGGANPGSFAGAAAINLSFVGNTTTPQNMALTCTSAATAQAATLTCNETRGTAAPVQRQWPLNCPAGTAVGPTIAYNPNAGSPVNFTGVTTIGTTGNGTIAATPSGGIGTGAGATTTINSCTLGGANPGSFAGAAAINLSFVGNTTTPQNLALTCTSAATAQTATLTCNETRGTAAPVQRQWPLNCPAGTPVAPTIAYNPATGAMVGFTGVTTIGTTGSGTIIATPSGGAGTGAAATTTINGCTLGGANPGSFAGAAAINLSFVGNTTTPANLALSCTAGAAAQTATLTCNETRGAAAPVQRQWPLNCPAGTLLPLTASPAIGTTVTVTGTAAGATLTTPITLANPNPIAVSLSCTAPGFPFTATPLVFTIPANASAPVSVGIIPTSPGNYTGVLNCTIEGSTQAVSFNLAGVLAPATPIDAMSAWSRWLLTLLVMVGGLALAHARRQ